MSKAFEIARDTLVNSLPPGVPPYFASIDTAAFDGKSVVAALTMFDGQPAVARFRRWAYGWSLGWDSMPGGDVSFENGRWVRVRGETQPSLFDLEAA